MKELSGKVAVVTGAARGIGFALCEQFAEAGMKLVLADIDTAGLAEAEKALQSKGSETLAVVTDVSREQDLRRLADNTIERFGAAHVLCNNAGIFGRPAYAWEQSPQQWRAALDINLWGVINGIRAFVPIMLQQASEAHVVNVASVAGHLVQPFMTPYHASKFAVAAISESLYHELDLLNSSIGVTLLCPGFTNTGILGNRRDDTAANDELTEPERMRFIRSSMETGVNAGMSTRVVAEKTLAAIRENRFYVFPGPHTLDMIKVRFDGILAQENPDMDAVVKQRFNPE